MLALVTAMAVAAQVAAAQPVQKDDDPIICTRENVGSEVGTRMRPKKVCMHKSDRNFIAKQEKDAIRQLINNGDARMATPSEQPR
jgi:hypothetical protein